MIADPTECPKKELASGTADKSVCHFFRLPPELRDIIYNQVITDHVQGTPRHLVRTALQAFATLPRLLRTCTGIWMDAGKIFCVRTAFFYRDIEPMVEVLERLSQQHRRAIRRIEDARRIIRCSSEALAELKGEYARLTEHGLHRDIDIGVLYAYVLREMISCGPGGQAVNSRILTW